MKTIPSCTVCGQQGVTIHCFLVAIEDVKEELRDISMVGECPRCKRNVTLSMRALVRLSQEATNEEIFGDSDHSELP